MKSIWELLDLEPTQDITAIRRAYARQSRKYHPEENQEMFLALRKAYEAALGYSAGSPQDGCLDTEPPQSMDASVSHRPDKREDMEEENIDADISEPEIDSGWTILWQDTDQGPNPYLEHPAYQQFLLLYTGSQRKNPKSWMDYFTSSVFLSVARAAEFTALLLEAVTGREEEYPPTKEFLTWLHIAYTFSSEKLTGKSVLPGRERNFSAFAGSSFNGIDSLFEIASKGPIPKKPINNELALFISFTEYWRLMELARSSGWNDQALEEAADIIDRYQLAYIQDKCTRRDWNEAERHPAGLRLLNDFFANQQLPSDLYRILWSRLPLKSATHGRSKLLYGELRRLVLQQIPKIEEEKPDNFLKLTQDFTAYTDQYDTGEAPDSCEAIDAADRLFAREDLKKALKHRDFVRHKVLNYWISPKRCDYFLHQLTAFYTRQMDAPYSKQVIHEVGLALNQKKVKRQLEEDRTSPLPQDPLTLSYRPFFRYWINLGFSLAYNLENGSSFPDYLKEHFPFLPDPACPFLQAGEKNEPVSYRIEWEGKRIEIVFHRLYMEYFCNDEPVYCPWLSWDLIQSAENDVFFLLLPIALTTHDRYPQVKEEILHRLVNTAAPKDKHRDFAAFLASHTCRLTATQNETETGSLYSALPLELYAETAEGAYGCRWYPHNGILVHFEQTPEGRKNLPDGYYRQINSQAAAISLARRLLHEDTTPFTFQLSWLNNLPEKIYAAPRYGAAVTLEREEITRKKVEQLIKQFGDWKKMQQQFQEKGGFTRLHALAITDLELVRLELAWPSFSLVFISNEAGFGCFYFDDGEKACYSMLSIPEAYQTTEADQAEYLPFQLGKLPTFCIHSDTAAILRKLDTVFMEIEQNGKPLPYLTFPLIWCPHGSLNGKEQKYNAAKQKLGAFPMDRACCKSLLNFILSEYPVQLESETLAGEQNYLEIGRTNRNEVSNLLIQFMLRRLRRLKLSWILQSKDQLPYRFQLVLLQDNGCFMMAYLHDDLKITRFYVADKQTYMNIEGKKYPKDTFLGRTAPAYLVHHSLPKIRNCLDLLFDDMANNNPILDQFGEFASWETDLLQA